jgi:hypothetical protein
LPRESKTGKPAAPRRENQIHARERETLPAAQGISRMSFERHNPTAENKKRKMKPTPSPQLITEGQNPARRQSKLVHSRNNTNRAGTTKQMPRSSKIRRAQQIAQNKIHKGIIFFIEIKQDYNWSMKVTALSYFFDYWKWKLIYDTLSLIYKIRNVMVKWQGALSLYDSIYMSK